MNDLDALESALGPLARRGVEIGALTTYRVGGRARLFAEVGSAVALEQVAAAVRARDVALLVLGNGSNLLVADGGFAGLCVRLAGQYAAVQISRGVADAGGGVSYPVLARRCAAAGLSGMSFAVGIPGTVGGAVAMNAGGHGAETATRLVHAELIDLRAGASRRATPAQLGLAYRCSNVAPSEVVTTARFAAGEDEPAVLEAEIADIVAWRRENQPGGRNGGSVFTNPPGDSAGRIVEAAGLKGHRVGGAVVSDKHANFIQADPSARAEDVYRLICDVRELVAQRTGVELSLELRLVGFAK